MRDKTPIRSALLSGSVLQQSVNSGLHALTKAHRSYVDPDIRDGFADSLDIDAGLKAGHPQEHRWDYLLGLTDRRVVVGFEPHSAKQGEISIVISKRRAALDQLRGHLRQGVRVNEWFWVASGQVHFANTEKARLSLDQHGITFVGTRLQSKHIAPKDSK